MGDREQEINRPVLSNANKIFDKDPMAGYGVTYLSKTTRAPQLG